MMVIERFYTPGLAQVAYGVADPEAKVAAIVDPRRDVGEYLAWAEAEGYRIEAILETHVHADFVSGARELAAATEATVYAGRIGETEFPHQPLNDSDVVPVGRLRLQALWTPGHTPEHISYLLFDPAQGEEALALFSGDVLFAGEIGRPDLLGPAKTGGLVEQLYETITRRLATLPDQLIVYPGHGAGSPCGKKIGDAAQTTIGQEKLVNYAFQTKSKDDFVRVVMAGMPKPPAYYPTMKRVNKVGPTLLAEIPASQPLSPDEVVAHHKAGALLIDARPTGAFAREHIPGAINVALGPSFPIWAGWVAPDGQEVVLVLPADEHLDEVLTDLRRIGVDKVTGYLRGGIDAWKASGRDAEAMPEISIRDLATRIGISDRDTVVLDVRDPAEWTAGHIAGSRNLAAGEIAAGARPTLDNGRPVAVICGTGYRSNVAASILQAAGIAHVHAVPGGMSAWADAGLPTEAGEPGEAVRATSGRLAAPWQGHDGAKAPEIDAADLRRHAAASAVQIVDVREPDEWAAGHIPGSVHLPMAEMGHRVGELDRDVPVVTVCRIGVRSLMSADELLRAGFPDVRSLAGGIAAWTAAGYPVSG